MTFATAQEFEQWFRERCAEGRPPDALDQRIEDEAERFFSKLAQGAEGHVYWMGAQQFRTNDGRSILPRRWWWFHTHGESAERVQVVPVCGAPHCISPRHMKAISWSELKRRYTDEQMIGALQVVAMRLGRAPTLKEWTQQKLQPHQQAIVARFGTWNEAMRAAGLEPRPTGVNTAHGTVWVNSELVRLGAALIRRLGREPSSYEWSRRLYQPAYSTIKRRFGTWTSFLEECRALLRAEDDKAA